MWIFGEMACRILEVMKQVVTAWKVAEQPFHDAESDLSVAKQVFAQMTREVGGLYADCETRNGGWHFKGIHVNEPYSGNAIILDVGFKFVKHVVEGRAY
jgi:hypothetical protein